MKKKLYNSPSMEIHALKVERGFAQSYDSDGMLIFDRLGDTGTDDGNFGLE